MASISKFNSKLNLIIENNLRIHQLAIGLQPIQIPVWLFHYQYGLLRLFYFTTCTIFSGFLNEFRIYRLFIIMIQQT